MNRFLFTLIIFVMLWPLSLFADGKDEEPKLTNISVAEDSVIAKFSIGDSITFNTNFDSICGGFRERIIESGTKNIIYEAFNSVKNEKGEWVLKFYEEVVLQKEHTYTLEIEGHEVADSKSKAMGKVSVIYIGDGVKEEDFVDDYEYSNIKYLRFSIEDGGELNSLSLNFIDIRFSGEVIIDEERSKIIDEDGLEHNFENIMPHENMDNYWHFIIPLELMLQSTSSITLRIYATDMAGRAVKGNVKDYVGKGGNNYYELTYKCEFGYPILSVSPEEGSYMSLKDFTFSNADGIEIKNGDNEIQLLSSNNEVLASFLADSLKMGANNLSYTYSFEQVFDTVGYFKLKVPEGTFSIGTKKKDNRETLITYEISSKLKSYGLENISPEDGSEVQSLSKIIITFNDIAMPESLGQQKITLTDDSDSIITYAKAIIDENRENHKQCIIELGTVITTPGNYHLYIPAKAFSLGPWGESSSKEMTFDYTIVELTNSVDDITIETIANEENMLHGIKLSFNQYSSVNVVGIKDEQRIGVILTDSLNNEIKAGLRIGQFYNQLIVDQIESKLSTGKYLLHIPANVLILDGNIFKSELILEIDFDLAYDVEIRTEENLDHNLEEIDLVFLKYGIVDLTGGRTTTYHDVTMTDDQNNVVATAQIRIGRQQNNLLVVDNIRTVDSMKDELGEKLGAGNYWLHVPAGIMIFDGETYNKEYVLEIEFSPIVTDAPSTVAQKANGRVRVYNAQGMLTRDVKDPEKALRGLRRGLYIINGKKVLVK